MKSKGKKSRTQRVISILVACVFLLIGIFVAPPTGLEVAGWRALCILFAFIVLWITEAFPVIITCILLPPTLRYMGVLASKAIYSSAANASVYFLMAGFGIGAAMMNTSLPNRIMRILMRWAKGDSRKIVAGFVFLGAAISLFMSDGAACCACVAILVPVLDAIGNPEPGTSNLAKGMMMAIPYGSLAGGFATPASNGINVTIIDLLETTCGVKLSFLQWSILGIPFAIIMTLFLAWWLSRYCKPETLSEEQINRIDAAFSDIPDHLSSKDIKFIIIIAAMIFLWVAGNWWKWVEVSFVAILGIGVMFLPGVELISGKDYMKQCKPNSIILLLCVLPLASAMKSSGAGQWLVSNLFSGASNWPAFAVLMMITFACIVVHLLVPSGASCATICCAIMLNLAMAAGLNLSATALIVAVGCGANFMLPLEGLYSFTFGYGHYSFNDTIRCGWVPMVVEFVLAVIMIPALAMVTGMA